jgi:transposase
VIEELVPDLLWEQVAPLLPAPRPRPYRHPGRRRADDRAALAGIAFVLRHGVGWRQVPQVLGDSGVTCWRRLREWTEAGV